MGKRSGWGERKIGGVGKEEGGRKERGYLSPSSSWLYILQGQSNACGCCHMHSLTHTT